MEYIPESEAQYTSRTLTARPIAGQTDVAVQLGLATDIFKEFPSSLEIYQINEFLFFTLFAFGVQQWLWRSNSLEFIGDGEFQFHLKFIQGESLMVLCGNTEIARLTKSGAYISKCVTIELNKQEQSPDFFPPTTLPAQPPATSARIKIARANAHINELEALIAAYWQTNPYTVFRHSDSERSYTRRVVVSRFPPEEIPAVIGDAIHNARSALDHLAVWLVEQNGASGKGVYFPIAKSASDLEALITVKNFHRAGRKAVALIKTFEPYDGGNPKIGQSSILRGLHELDINDKHKLIVPTFTQVLQPTLHLRGEIAIIRKVDDANVRLDHGAILDTGLDIHMDIEDKRLLLFRVVFEQPGQFAGEDVVSTLKAIVDYVENIVDAFENL